MENLLVCKNNNDCISIGKVWYNIVSDEIVNEISSDMVEMLPDSEEGEDASFVISVEGSDLTLTYPTSTDVQKFTFNSNIIERLMEWIYSIEKNKNIIKITYNWITADNVQLQPNESYYILTLTSDDYVSTYLSINYESWNTIKYTKSKDLYPDEREDNQHYYDGGCLIYIPTNPNLKEIKASNCLIFHII